MLRGGLWITVKFRCFLEDYKAKQERIAFLNLMMVPNIKIYFMRNVKMIEVSVYFEVITGHTKKIEVIWKNFVKGCNDQIVFSQNMWERSLHEIYRK